MKTILGLSTYVPFLILLKRPAVVREITRRPSASIPGDVIAQMMKVQDVTAFASASLEAPSAKEVQQ
jgi:hypothetical protein